MSATSKTVSYEYNLNGSLYKLHYPSGAAVTYTPDSAGRTLSAVDSGSGINYVTGATYGPDSSLTGFISGSGGPATITSSFTYNKRLQPVTMSATTASQTVYSIGYDFHLGNGDNGNVFGIINYKDTTHGRDQTFTYDALNRLTSAQNAGTDCTAKVLQNKTEYWGNSYAYDAWGNLLQKNVTKCGAENLVVTADAHNWLHASGTDYLYDAAGNMTYDATASLNYAYDQENRLTGAAGYTYTYDGDGNRVRKSNGNLAANGTLYWYMTPGVVAETDLAGTLKSEYVFFDGERVARKDFPGNAVAYYFSDQLKTASVITDSTGNIKSESDYYPWGGELQFVNNDSNDYKFTGKKRDTETGLDYFGARYYSNGLGRWISADWSPTPIPVPYADFHDPQSLNLYGFVGGNPASKADPDGHCPDGGCTDYLTAQQSTDTLKFLGGELVGVGKAIINAIPSAYNAAANFINTQIEADPQMHSVPLMTPAPTLPVNGPAETVGNGVGQLGIVVAGGAKGNPSTAAGETEAGASGSALPKEGVYEGPDATAPGKTYVGQSGDIPNRVTQHEASGKFAPGTKVAATEVKGGKTAREVAEHNRIQQLGGVRSKPGSQTSNVRNPIGKNREHLLKKEESK